MSLVQPKIDIMPQTMDADTVRRGAFLQNVLRVSDAWEVRKGFGQLCQFDTTLAFGNPVIRSHLGSKSIQTSFGHEQIVSAFSADVFTGNASTGSNFLHRAGRYARCVLVGIYDVTTRELWEEVLYPTTTSNTVSVDQRHGVRETSQSNSYDDMTSNTDKPLWWVATSEAMFFGSSDIGVWAYVPASFCGKRPQFIPGETWNEAHFRGESESCLIRSIPPGLGVGWPARAYLDATLFPAPTAACDYGTRLVYASGNTIWFSDPGAPGSVMADNWVQLWGSEPITAVQSVADRIMVWTTHTTWAYEPSAGGTGLLSGGRLSLLDDSIGCHGQNALTPTPNGVVWVDQKGPWISDGLRIKPIGEGVNAFWRGDGIANPMTSYYNAAGRAFIDQEQPPVRWAWDKDDLRVNLAYESDNGLTILTFPTQRISLAWDGQRWALWNYEASPGAYLGAIHSTRTYQLVQNPWVVSGRGLYIVGGPETNMVTDHTCLGGGGAVDDNIACFSWYLLEWGRGGGIERSVEHVSEDRRIVQGRYYELSGYLAPPPTACETTCFYIDPWIPVPEGYVFPGGQVAPARTYLWPVSLVCDPVFTTGPAFFWLRFQFDNTNWRPIYSAAAHIDALHPCERLASATGYREIQTYSLGAPNAGGNEIRIQWAVPVGSTYGCMNMPLGQRSPVLYLPMVHTTNANTVSAGIVPTQSAVWSVNPPLVQRTAGFIAWQECVFCGRYHANEPAQPVDWAMKAAWMATADDSEVKSCGITLKVKSHGRGVSIIPAMYGLLNSVCGSDHKDWTSQIVDYVPTTTVGAGGPDIQRVSNVGTLRTRFQDSTVMQERTFGGTATWGSTLDGATGNFLVDTEEFNRVAMADRCRGEQVNWMVFGSVLNRAEALTVGDMKADLIVVGGSKRRGR